MKIKDLLGFSVFNIKRRKARITVTTLMIILLFAVALVIALVAGIGYRYPEHALEKVFEEEGSGVYIYQDDMGSLSLSEFIAAKNALDDSGYEYTLVEDGFSATVAPLIDVIPSGLFALSDVGFKCGEQYKDGELWLSARLYNSLNQLIEDYAESIPDLSPEMIEPGSTIKLKITIGQIESIKTFSIGGVVSEEENKLYYGFYLGFTDAIKTGFQQYIRANIAPVAATYDDLAKDFSSLQAALESACPGRTSKGESRINIDVVTSVNAVRAKQAIYVVIALVLSTLLIIMCINGVTNSIAITAMENEKSYGLMRAFGLKQRETYFILILETLIVCVVSAVISVLLAVAAGGAIAKMSAALWGAQSLKFTLIWWQPFAILAFLLAAAAISAWVSVKKMYKSDILSALREGGK